MDIWYAIRRSRIDHWIDGSYYLGWTVLGMMPLWLLFLILLFCGQDTSLEVFGGDGQFALYSAAVLSGAMHVVHKEVKLSSILRGATTGDLGSLRGRWQVRFPSYRLLGLASFGIMIFSALLYTLATLASLLPGAMPALVMDRALVGRYTVILLAFSLFMSFIITVVDNAEMRDVDVLASLQEEKMALDRRFDEIESEE